MKTLRKYKAQPAWAFFCATVLFALASCKPSPTAVNDTPAYEAQFPHATTYEVFVQSFADSNGDGIGDINGLRGKLDYLQDLGVKALWLMPMSPSPSYHKYDVTDYRAIHPDYGTMDDFKALIVEAHDRDIRIIIDLVVNHTAREHPWFLESMKGPENPYRDYYVWRPIDQVAEEIEKKETSMDSDNLTQWHQVEGQEEYYYGFFWGGMPDLNFDNPTVRQEIIDIGKFWLAEVGVDGFRLDAAKHIFPDDRPTDNHEWWVEFRQAMETVKPDVYMVGEVWAEAEVTAPYFKGLHAVFNFDMAFDLVDDVSLQLSDTLLQRHLNMRQTFREHNPAFVDATFLRNHDQNRVMSELGGSTAKAKLAASILFTLPGAPFLYYGEEIGMLGQKPDPNIREPMLWAHAGQDNARTTWMEPAYSTDSTVVPVSQQQADSASLYHHYRRLIQLRHASKALSEGTMLPLSSPKSVLAFWRKSENDSVLVLHNLSMEPRRLPQKTVASAVQGGQVLFGTRPRVEGDKTVLAPGSSAVIKKAPSASAP